MVSKGSIGLSWKDLSERIGQENILSYYLGITKLPCLINSPLRKDDKPSFGFKYHSDGNITYYDFSTKEGGSLLTFLKQYFNASYTEVINKVGTDLLITSLPSDIKLKINRKIGKVTLDSEVDIKVKIRNFKPYDIEYWSSYGISKEWLNFGKIYPISHFFVNKNNQNYTIPADKYAYVYIENKDNKLSLKIYQPYSLYKWINTHNSSVWDLWEQLPPTGDKLIITSSRKDALCIWSNTGVPATSLQAESYLPKPQVIEELKRRFKTIYVLYDNDFTKQQNWGNLFGQKLAMTYGLKQIEIPRELNSKDSSDLYKNYNSDIFVSEINKLLN